MAPPRLFVPGLSHHVYHRGNNRCQIFHDDDDRAIFLLLLRRAAKRGDVQVHGYALMGTHYHALVTAPDEKALPQAMQRLGRAYVRHFNDRYMRTGTLWEGRYKASLIADERYWLTCLRYIEMNPVAAHMVEAPDEYAWSSYRHHASGAQNTLVSPHMLIDALGRTAAERQAEWRALCGLPIAPDHSALIRQALRTNGVLQEPESEEPTKSAA